MKPSIFDIYNVLLDIQGLDWKGQAKVMRTLCDELCENHREIRVWIALRTAVEIAEVGGAKWALKYVEQCLERKDDCRLEERTD
jgi:hypothetical protein